MLFSLQKNSLVLKIIQIFVKKFIIKNFSKFALLFLLKSLELIKKTINNFYLLKLCGPSFRCFVLFCNFICRDNCKKCIICTPFSFFENPLWNFGKYVC